MIFPSIGLQAAGQSTPNPQKIAAQTNDLIETSLQKETP